MRWGADLVLGPVGGGGGDTRAGYRVRRLRDSKLLLPERQRNAGARIPGTCCAWAVAAVDAAARAIDQINIYHASRPANACVEGG